MGGSIMFVIFKLCFFIVAPVLTSFVAAGISLYVAVRDVDVLLKVFENSAVVADYSPGSRDSPISVRLLFVSILSGAILWQGRCMRNGSIDPQNLARLPGPLKKKMLWSAAFAMAGGGWLCINFLVMKNFL